MGQPNTIPAPQPRIKGRWRRRYVIGLACVLVTAFVAAGVAWYQPIVRCGSFNPFSQIRLANGECIGVTDGAYAFDPDFHTVQAAIKSENDWVAKQHETQGTPAVKIALLSTLTVNDTSPLNRAQVRHSIEGAYVAQRRANRTEEFKSREPLIQLVLANEGSTQHAWKATTNQLIDMTNDDIPLAVVMGQGISTSFTTDAAEKLSKAGIPIVTGTTMADNLDNAHIPGLIRAAPSNTDAAIAIRRYLDSQSELNSGILVFDNESSDTFVTSLKAAFETHLDSYFAGSDQPYPGSSITQNGLNVFDQITQNICLADTDMVFFAGRAPDFEIFLDSLAARICADRHVTAVFVDLGLNPRNNAKLRKLLEENKITVLQATGYDPGWLDGTVKAPKGFEAFHARFKKLLGGDPDALNDGYAVTNHDSMAAAISAVRITNPWENTTPSPEAVRNHLLLLNGVNAVQGATGRLQFNENRNGNPGGKYVPVVSLPPNSLKSAAPYITPVE